MIITCPFCQTKYQVARDAIGSAGRKVQCAHCQKAWQASAEAERPAPPRPVLVKSGPRDAQSGGDDDKLFDDMAELGLDEAFTSEERASAPAPIDIPEPVMVDEPAAETLPVPVSESDQTDVSLARTRQRAYVARQNRLAQQLPYAKVRRTVRAVAVVALVLFVGGGFLLRTQLVRLLPDLAGLYESVGLGVNVVGLEFTDLSTLRTADAGAEVMLVNAKIYSVSGQTVPIPPVVVTLLDEAGTPIFEWSVTPTAKDIAPGEVVNLSAEVTAPPAGASGVRLTFASNRRLAGNSQATTAATPVADVADGAPHEPATVEHGATEPEAGDHAPAETVPVALAEPMAGEHH